MAQTFSAAQVAQAVTRLTGKYLSPKRVRGWARGDSGVPVVKRFGHDVKADRAAHQYSAAEANALGERAVKAHNASTGQSVKWRAIGTTTKTTRKGASTPRVTKTTTKTASAPSVAASVAQSGS